MYEEYLVLSNIRMRFMSSTWWMHQGSVLGGSMSLQITVFNGPVVRVLVHPYDADIKTGQTEVN